MIAKKLPIVLLGNNRHYSKSIADAVYMNYWVNKDFAFAMQQLDNLKT